MNRLLAILGVVALVTVVGIGHGMTQEMGDAPDDEKKCGGSDDAMDPMEEFAKTHATNENHELLAKMAGDFTFTAKMWFEPGKDPAEGSGTCNSHMSEDGRRLIDSWDMKEGPMPMKGSIIAGYNNVDERFELVEAVNGNTGMLFYTGSYDEDTGVLAFKGSCNVIMGGQKMKRTTRTEIKIIDADNRVMTMYAAYGDMKEHKEVEVTYKRVKEDGDE